MSIPEPKPKNEGVEIYPIVLKRIEESKMNNEDKNNLIKLLNDRYTFGLKKYGQSLMSQDGRDSIEDAIQELGDFLMYYIKAELNKENTEKLKKIFNSISIIFKS